MNKKPICIYHANCDDGFGAAFSIWKRFGEDFEYFAGVYQNPPPDIKGRDVFIVDFSYKRPVMEKLCRDARSVTILDHHASAQKDLAGLDTWARQQGLDVTVEFDMNRSGAMITWMYCHYAKPVPKLIQYIQDRDLWLKKMPNGDEFSIALRSYPQRFDLWNRLDVDELIQEGHHIQRYYRTQVEVLKGNATRETIAGYDVPVVNANYCFASELAGELSEGEPFAACYFYTKEGKVYSLRSKEDGVDVSEVAAQYGGGGHKHAAGFRVSK